MGSRSFCNHRYLFTLKEKYLEKVISLTFRMHINLHMFRDEFVVKKKRFLTSAEVLTFSHENSVTKEF